MKRVSVLLALVLAFLWATNTVKAQCRNGRCSAPSVSAPIYVPSQIVPASVDASTVKWWALNSEPGVIALLAGDKYLGKLDLYDGIWTPENGAPKDLREMSASLNPASGEKMIRSKLIGAKPAVRCNGTDCDCANCDGPSCKCKPTKLEFSPLAKFGVVADKKEMEPRDNGPPTSYQGGVDYSQIRADGDHYICNGKQCTRAEALNSLAAASSVPDDSASVRLTVIGGAAIRQQILSDIDTRPEFGAFKGKFVLASYASDHWRIKDGGFKVPGNPNDVMIYAQKPDGSVLWRQEGYVGGSGKLAAALRDKVPGYDPVKDPNPDNVPLIKPIEPHSPIKSSSVLWWLVGGSALFGSLVYARRA